MPLREDLLTPIAGESPAGASLRYDRVYDQIKDARTEEDDSLPSGAWARTAKRADFRAVAKLASDALFGRSKDLQLAVWLGEALLKQEGVSTLTPTLRLLLDLQQTFWDSLFPEIDEGDAGMRAAPLQWAANRYAKLLNEAALTRKGIGILEYKAARAIGTEEEASSNDAKRQAREEAIAAGKLTAEELDDAIAATPKAFYVALEQSLTSALEVLEELNLFSEERYGDDSPSFRTLRQGLEEVQNLAASLLREKRKLEPDLPAASTEVEDTMEEDLASIAEDELASPQFVESADSAPVNPVVTNGAAPGQRARPTSSMSATPDSWEDALQRIESAVAYMNTQQSESAMPFLLRHAMRSADLQRMIANSQQDALPAPATELRQLLKRKASEGDWTEVHRIAFEALGTLCGSGWLDLYRYLWTSCYQLDWIAQQRSIAGAMQQRLHEVPGLPTWTLNDDTPAATAETLRWIAEEIAPPVETAEHATEEQTAPVPPLELLRVAEHASEDESDAEDLYVTARGLAAHGQIQGAIQLLARDAAHQSVGRLRFGRNLQIAELCLESGNSAVAVPVLQGLVREVEERRLESWEPPDSAARPYALLLQCASVAKLDAQSIFARLCAIDPSAALTMVPPVET